MRSIMTISEWIKSRTKYDIDHKLTSERHSLKEKTSTIADAVSRYTLLQIELTHRP